MSVFLGPNAVVPAPGSLPSTAAEYDLGYQICPIILQGGLVSNVQGGIAPITTYLPTTGANGEPFCRFVVVPGGTLIDQAIGMYPFASQSVAANATIQQPLKVSLLMIAPVNQPGGYLTKRDAFTALQQTLATHNAQGGTYAVATPAFLYNFVVMTAMTDVSEEIEADGNKQAQILWQLDFTQPIVTAAAAAAAQGGLMAKLSAGSQLPNPPPVSGITNASPANLTNVIAALEAFGSLPNIDAAAGTTTTTGQVGPQQ